MGDIILSGGSATSGGATADNQTSGAQKTQIVDAGGDAATVTSSRLDVNAVITQISSTVDSTNSSTTPLGSNASFTGSAIDVLSWDRVTVMVFSDQSSASLGLKIEFGPDGTNWYDASTFTFTAGGTSPNSGQVFSTAVRGHYMRVVYTNGASAQGSFNLQTILQPTFEGADIIDLQTTAADYQHAMLTKSLIIGKSTAGGGAGSYVSVKVNPSGSLAVSSDLASVGGTTVALGQTTMSASIPVVVASDQTPIMVIAV